MIKVPQSLRDELEVSRNSTAECFDFIIEDLVDAIAVLPPKDDGSYRGRIDKASALSFKGRIVLYKASPEFNSSNSYGTSYWAMLIKRVKLLLESKNAIEGDASIPYVAEAYPT